MAAVIRKDVIGGLWSSLGFARPGCPLVGAKRPANTQRERANASDNAMTTCVWSSEARVANIGKLMARA
jgi:hypothetical protein